MSPSPPRQHYWALLVIVAFAAWFPPRPSAAASPPLQITLQPIPVPGASALPPPSPKPDLTVESLTLDRGSYFVGTDWVATVRTTNIGDAPSGAHHLVFQLCRVLEGTTVITCPPEEVLATPGGSLDPGDSEEFPIAAVDFSSLPLDASPSYTSELAGIPNGGTVYIEVSAREGSPGQASPPPEYDLSNNLAVKAVFYPSAPADPAYDPAADPDGDGWTSPADCNPDNPRTSPWSYEIAGDGIDNDCYGGDAPPDTTCVQDAFYSQGGGCNPPGIWNDTTRANLDLDGDGYSASEDCDDANSAISPGADERADGADNNCNGLIDETFVTPDWTFSRFELWKGWVSPGYLTGDYGGIYPYYMPALRYSFDIANVGESLGEGEAGLVDSLVLVRDLGGTLFSVGNGGFIPYTAFSYGSGYVPACDPVGLVALIPGPGVYGETNMANNAAAANTPPQPPFPNVITDGPFDRDLHFVSAPELSVFGVFHHSEAVGSCPPLLDYVTSSDLPNVYTINYRVYAEGRELVNLTQADSYFLSNGFEEDLHGGDRVCVEIRLDPENWVFEVDETNNTYLQVFTYRNPLIGASHYDLVDAYSDGPGTCSGGELVPGSGVGQTGSALTSSGAAPVLGALGGAVFAAAVAAALAAVGVRRLTGAPPVLPALLAAGLAGALAGGFGGAALVRSMSAPAGTGWIVTQTPASLASPGSQSCDRLVDWTSSSPADGESKQPGDTLWLQVQTQDLSEVRRTDRWVIDVLNPTGRELTILVPGGGDSIQGDLVESAMQIGGPGFFEPGEYTWQIAIGLSATGDPETPYSTTCTGSSLHHFSIARVAVVPAPVTATLQASGTASPSPSPVPASRTPTRTPTVLPDATGPTISGMSDSPDPIYVSQPAGCTPTTTTIQASIDDPSGVESASVLFFHTTIGAVDMVHGSGTTWTATLGPFTGTGDGTADYQIQATDELGNVSASGFAAVTVLACIP